MISVAVIFGEIAWRLIKRQISLGSEYVVSKNSTKKVVFRVINHLSNYTIETIDELYDSLIKQTRDRLPHMVRGSMCRLLDTCICLVLISPCAIPFCKPSIENQLSSFVHCWIGSAFKKNFEVNVTCNLQYPTKTSTKTVNSRWNFGRLCSCLPLSRFIANSIDKIFSVSPVYK